MSDLAKKIRKSREFSREVRGWRLRMIRPLVGELHKIFKAEQDRPMTELEIAVQFTIDWGDVKECDLVKSGNTEPVAFDREAWREILTDDPVLWRDVCAAIFAEVEKYKEKEEERSKN